LSAGLSSESETLAHNLFMRPVQFCHGLVDDQNIRRILLVSLGKETAIAAAESLKHESNPAYAMW